MVANTVPCKNHKIVNVFMLRLYGFYAPEIGDTHTWVLQYVNPIVKALN